MAAVSGFGLAVAKSPAPQPRYVAVVEDDPGVREAIRDLLKSAGLASHVFRTAESFLRSGIIRCVGCLIVDTHLPGMSGLALRKRLLDKGVVIPTVVITSHDPGALRSWADEPSRGTIAVLCKPFDSRQLLSAVRAALHPTR